MQSLDELYGFILNMYFSAKKRGIPRGKRRQYCVKYYFSQGWNKKFTVEQFTGAIQHLKAEGRI